MRSLITFSLEASNNINVNATSAWDCVESLLGTLQVVFTVLSQLILIISFAMSGKNSSVILFLCLVWPIFTKISRQTLWSECKRLSFPIIRSKTLKTTIAFIAYATHQPYLRLRMMFSLATEATYKKEVISGGMGTYIMQG